MCGDCCNCSAFALCLGNLTFVITRLAQCTAATAAITCIMLTLLVVLVVGVGSGYHYCVVEHKVNDTLKASRSINKPKLFCETGDRRRSGDASVSNVNSPVIQNRQRRSKDDLDQPLQMLNVSAESQMLNGSVVQDQPVTDLPLEIKPTMIVPLKHVALVMLIKNLQKKNKNFTLELIAAKF